MQRTKDDTHAVADLKSLRVKPHLIVRSLAGKVANRHECLAEGRSQRHFCIGIFQIRASMKYVICRMDKGQPLLILE